MYPSVKTIMTRLEEPIREQSESPKQAAERIRHFMMDEDPDYAMERINTLLGGYGVEAIRDHDFSRYYGDIGLLYVNMCVPCLKRTAAPGKTKPLSGSRSFLRKLYRT